MGGPAWPSSEDTDGHTVSVTFLLSDLEGRELSLGDHHTGRLPQ